jgi:hypothetical protein
MLFTMTAYENVGDTRMWDIKAGDPVMRVEPLDKNGRPVGTFTVTAETIEEALETLWHIGNKQPNWSDDLNRVWPTDRRSMSMGDIVNAEGHGTYKVATVGWESTGDDVFHVVGRDSRALI